MIDRVRRPTPRGWALLLVVGLSACSMSAARWSEEGDRLLRQNDLAAAEQAYSRALQLEPHYGPAIYGKAWALYASGHQSLRPVAKQLFSRAIEYAPSFYGGYRGKGVLLLEEGQVLAAERLLREAYKHAPDEPAVLGSLGQLYLQADRLEEAEEMFRGAMSLAPERGELRRYLADLALARNDFEGALAAIEQGRAGPVGGLRGRHILDEGEEVIRLERARRWIDEAEGAADPRLTHAQEELERAEQLLETAEQGPGGTSRVLARRRYHQLLLRRLEQRAAL
ncbi:MAG TPA: hypothetical protein DIU15_05360 [Deltaproteobacteria bacterium]|nr:hypothetical protein [Deltaproteobacteria bacterium]HCP45446.1 hypothetical protein [Deltaproteobacteria bacterium]